MTTGQATNASKFTNPSSKGPPKARSRSMAGHTPFTGPDERPTSSPGHPRKSSVARLVRREWVRAGAATSRRPTPPLRRRTTDHLSERRLPDCSLHATLAFTYLLSRDAPVECETATSEPTLSNYVWRSRPYRALLISVCALGSYRLIKRCIIDDRGVCVTPENVKERSRPSTQTSAYQLPSVIDRKFCKSRAHLINPRNFITRSVCNLKSHSREMQIQHTRTHTPRKLGEFFIYFVAELPDATENSRSTCGHSNSPCIILEESPMPVTWSPKMSSAD
ncbi:unnamed protein product [Phyllotreta striolata]|uniref:Uncharacterized protein n=1 Tax=Phyllotreta striolata TaxID=444603 RepID=A0A9N9XPD3_PHYSR|nr:unnamed protein product [Phyllotreta striolata]